MLEMFTDADPMRADDYALPADGWRANNSDAHRAQEGKVDIEREFNEIVGRAKVGATRLWSSEEKAICWAQDEIALLRAKLAAMESQEPVAWVTSRPDICYFTTGGESAERWRKGGWTVDPLYAKPVPADKPRITEQDAREIINAYIENKIGVPVNEWLVPLLNKLNADREQVSDVAPAQEQWSYYQTLLKQNGFDGITDLLAKYHKLAEQMPEVLVPDYAKIIRDLAQEFKEAWPDDNGKYAWLIGYSDEFKSAPSHSQQSAPVSNGVTCCGCNIENGRVFCAGQSALDRCPSHESEQSVSPELEDCCCGDTAESWRLCPAHSEPDSEGEKS